MGRREVDERDEEELLWTSVDQGLSFFLSFVQGAYL